MKNPILSKHYRKVSDGMFGFFMEERAKAIFALIEQYAIMPLTEMAERYGAGSDIEHNTESRRTSSDPLPRMLADGRINIGDRVYVTGHPDAVATIASGYDVEYEGRRIPINTWGQQITGWASINIYANVYLERTGKTLESLRQTSEDTPE
jgi:hypothetical protein